MPLQSGSDRILKAMRRAYRRDRYLGHPDRVRGSIPDAAITTDIIVGFPGETEEDFADTLDARAPRPVRSARSPSSYSIRPGTPAATMDDQVPAGGRAGALRAAHRAGRGDHLRGEPEAGRDGTSRCWWPRARAARTPPLTGMSGRARDNRLVHFTPAMPPGSPRPATSSW